MVICIDFTEVSHVVQVRAEGPGLGASAPSGRVGANLRQFRSAPTLKSKACLKCLYFTKIISDLCRNLEYFSYLYTIN